MQQNTLMQYSCEVWHEMLAVPSHELFKDWKQKIRRIKKKENEVLCLFSLPQKMQSAKQSSVRAVSRPAGLLVPACAFAPKPFSFQSSHYYIHLLDRPQPRPRTSKRGKAASHMQARLLKPCLYSSQYLTDGRYCWFVDIQLEVKKGECTYWLVYSDLHIVLSFVVSINGCCRHAQLKLLVVSSIVFGPLYSSQCFRPQVQYVIHSLTIQWDKINHLITSPGAAHMCIHPTSSVV